MNHSALALDQALARCRKLPPTELLYIRVPQPVAAAIEELAALAGMTKSEMAVKLLRLGIETAHGISDERRAATVQEKPRPEVRRL